MRPPAWLAADSPDSDVVVSSRFRLARNICGFNYPHTASNPQLVEVARLVLQAAKSLTLSPVKTMTEAERDYLLGARLISPEFKHDAPGRLILLDDERAVSVMVNEEDHLRIQAVTAGWSIKSAVDLATQTARDLGRSIDFQSAQPLGFLTASPTNLGGGIRRSALFHLAGLSSQGRLNRLIKSLHHLGVTTRGLFGESSRGIASFLQVSGTTIPEIEFIGACQHVITEERLARQETPSRETLEKAQAAAEFAVMSSQISMRDALLVLGFIRWAAAIDLDEFRVSPRTVDAWITEMEVFGTQSPTTAARQRADYLRSKIENLNRPTPV
jgi:protein arginine kinase